MGICKGLSGGEGMAVRQARSSRIVLVDEFALRRASTEYLLRTCFRTNLESYANVPALLAQLSAGASMPDAIIVSVGARSVKEASVPAILQALCCDLPSVPVIVMSDLESATDVVETLKLGVRGYILTSLDPSLVIHAIRIVMYGGSFVPAEIMVGLSGQVGESVPVSCETRAVVKGEDDPAPESEDQSATAPGNPWLPRQLAVLRLLIQGMANKEIAHTLEMEECTVKAHLRFIMRKLGASNRTQAALYARRRGILAAC